MKTDMLGKLLCEHKRDECTKCLIDRLVNYLYRQYRQYYRQYYRQKYDYSLSKIITTIENQLVRSLNED